MATTETKPKMVKIKLPLLRDKDLNAEGEYVGLNGKPYQIKRGVEVEVPVGVYEILETKEKMLAEAMEYESQAAANVQ